MMCGIWIGKCSPESIGYVQTFFYSSKYKRHYYLDEGFKIIYNSVNATKGPMVEVSPAILAFWCEE